MMFQVGDLVRIKSNFSDQSGNEFDWIGVILSYRGQGRLGGEQEWLVQWAHQPNETIEYDYYLEII